MPLFPSTRALGEYAYNLGSHDPFVNLPDDPAIQLVYLVELYPFSDTLTQNAAMVAPYPGVMALGEFSFRYAGGETVERLSDSGYVTKPSDSQPNRLYLGRVSNALQMETSVFGNNAFSASQSFGGLEIINPDGRYDRFFDYHWTDRRVVVKAGTRDFHYDDFAVIFAGTVSSIEGEEKRVLLNLGDNRARIDKPVVRARYGGTGGTDGMASITGGYKPLLFGKAFNFEPVLVDYANQIYQLHDGQVTSVEAVRDRGVRLTSAGDVSDILTATPGAGYYITQNSGGYIRLGSEPSGQITVDATGETAGGALDGASLALRILRTRLGIYTIAGSDYDPASFARLKAASPYAQGLFINGDLSGVDVLEHFIGRCDDFWSFTRQGQLFFGRPSVDMPLARVRRIQAEGVTLKQTLPPAWQVTVGYAPAVVVQGSNDLASATDADRAFVTNDYRYLTHTNDATRRQNAAATSRTFLTAIGSQADAQALLDHLVTIYGVMRQVFELTVFNPLYKYYIGDTVNLVYDRYGMENGRNFMIAGISENATSNQTTLTLWG